MDCERYVTPTGDLDAGMSAALERLRADSARNETPANNIAEARARAIENYRHWNEAGPALARVEDHEIEGAFGPSRIRIYRPNEMQDAEPGLVFFHGGGWIVGDLELEDHALRVLARACDFPVISVDYVLAPEHPFPEPIEDCVAVTRALRRRASEFGLGADRLAIGGSSAGANLALATALMLRDSDERWLRGLLCFYGVFSTRLDSGSHRRFAGEQYSPGGPGMPFFLDCYLPDPATRTHPLASIVDAELTGLPPVHLCVAELDTLHDDSVLLEERLRLAGVPTHSVCYAGMTHGFTLFARELAAARRALEDAARAATSWFQAG